MSAAMEHYERAIGHWAADQHEQAIDDLKAALYLKPDFRQARFNLAVCFIMMNRYDEALPELKSLLEADPSDALAYHYVGKMFAQKAKTTRSRYDWSSAKEAYQQSLILTPDNADALDEFAIVLLELGEFKEAARTSHAAVTLAPTDRRIAHNESAIGGKILRQYLSSWQWKEAWQLWAEACHMWRTEAKARRKACSD